MKRTLQVIIVTALAMGMFTAGWAENTPTEAIRSTVGAVLAIMKDKNLAAPDRRAERREKIRALIRSRFDFREMARRSLARHWKKISPEEEREFVAVFSDLLEASYIGKIEAYTDEKVTYDRETVRGRGKYGIVNTTIVTKDVDIPIDYKVIFRNGKWRIYDVVIEGVSFVSTYRSQYNKIIVKQSFAELLQRMKSKLKEIKAMEAKEAQA